MPDCDDQTETIAFLSRPDAYGLAAPVERVDTHGAVVFLAGDRAYKLKRAVWLPYLDFSTIEKRKAVCEAELRLNRRTAPELYLGVERVGRQPDGTLAIGQGTAVDWVVVMQRFPADALLDTMARQGPLPSRLVRDLADAIAAFHDTAGVVTGGGAARVRAVIDGNRNSMAALPAGLLAASQCDRLHALSLAKLDRLAPLLDRRAAAGLVRHCHGDLHLANICLWEGRPILFDCLEFDPELATTDVLYDIAFLLMDMWQRGLRSEASLAFNRYCDMRGEAEGLAAMPLFLSMRAAVRAHVSASAAQRQERAIARETSLQAARGYLAAALAFLEPVESRLVAIGGLSGTGKSTLAGQLAPLVGTAPGARWLRSDVLRKRMAGVAPEDRLPAQAYAPETSAAVYHALMEAASRTLQAGTSVIIDAVFADASERAAIAEVARRSGVPFAGLWLEAPPEALRARVTSRRGDASDANAAVVDRQLGYAVGDLGEWQPTDASGTPAEVAAHACQQLGVGAAAAGAQDR